ncbi:MAG: potassium channel family protein, partial [Thermoplasmatota archaeon]
MEILILGGGNVGGKLASDIEEPFTLIDADPSRIYELKLKFVDKKSDFRLIVGDGSDLETLKEAGGRKFDVAVILMNKDFENLEAAKNLRDLGVERIIARVNRSSNMSSFTDLGAEVFVHPVGYEEGLIKTMLYPDVKHALQIFVRDGSPAIDRSIRDLDMPSGSMIGSILRGDELIPPQPDIRIHRGDLIAIDTVGKSAKEVLKRFSKEDRADTTGKILLPITRDMDITAIKEAETLAKRLGSEIVFIVNPGTEDYLDYT